jgi:hypothetical protein
MRELGKASACVRSSTVRGSSPSRSPNRVVVAIVTSDLIKAVEPTGLAKPGSPVWPVPAEQPEIPTEGFLRLTSVRAHHPSLLLSRSMVTSPPTPGAASPASGHAQPYTGLAGGGCIHRLRCRAALHDCQELITVFREVLAVHPLMDGDKPDRVVCSPAVGS